MYKLPPYSKGFICECTQIFDNTYNLSQLYSSPQSYISMAIKKMITFQNVRNLTLMKARYTLLGNILT